MSIFYTDIKKYGSKILHRGYKNGIRFHDEVSFKPEAFIKSNGEPSDWKSLVGSIPMKKLEFDSMKDCDNFYKEYEDFDGFEIHGMKRYPIQFAHKFYNTDIAYDKNIVKSAFLDIEVHSDSINEFPAPHKAEFEVVTIAVVSSRNTIWCASILPKDQSKFKLLDSMEVDGVTYPIEYIQVSTGNEKLLLQEFLNYLKQEDFDIFSGWSSNNFDLPYLYNRISKVLGEKSAKRLSPWNNVYLRQFEKFGKINCDINIYGVQLLDYLEVFKKFGLTVFGPQENMKLNTISQTVLGEEKIDYSEYGNLKKLYNKNPKLHTEYCIHDALLVKRMEDKLGYFNIVYSLAYMGRVNYDETLGVTAYWDSYIYGELLKENICVPPHNTHSDAEFEGAYVKETIPGIYDWVLSVDIKSLYPYTIYQFNISPETLGEYIPNVNVQSLLDGNFPVIPDDWNLTATGYLFKKNELGIIPRLVIKGLIERDTIKSLMLSKKKELQSVPSHNFSLIKQLNDEIVVLDARQTAVKLSLNSLYGALGTGSFRYFDVRLAESVTLTGQFINRSSEAAINKYLRSILKDNNDRAIAGDTDSLYLNFSDIIKKAKVEDHDDLSKVNLLDRFYEDKIAPIIKSTQKTLADNLNARDSFISVKREGIAKKSIFIAKKRYIQYILNSEGVQYKEPVLKMMGVEAIKSTTPVKVKSLFKEVFKIMLTEGEQPTQEYIEDKFKWFCGLHYDDIAKPAKVSDLEKYDSKDNSVVLKKCPFNVRAALYYNKLLRDKNLVGEYDEIFPGDGIKVLNLRYPNTAHTYCIAYNDKLPPEFNLEKYIDYDEMWDRCFLKPVSDIMEICNWKATDETTLESFFG